MRYHCFLFLFFVTSTGWAQQPGAIAVGKVDFQPEVVTTRLQFSAGSEAASALGDQPFVYHYTRTPFFKGRMKGLSWVVPEEFMLGTDPDTSVALERLAKDYVLATHWPQARSRLQPVPSLVKSDTQGWMFDSLEYVKAPVETITNRLTGKPLLRPLGSRQMDYGTMQAAAATGFQPAFHLRENYVTNGEYEEFIGWVRDSMFRMTLGDQLSSDFFLVNWEEELPFEALNWDQEIDYSDPKTQKCLHDFYLADSARRKGLSGVDLELLNYVYYWIDFREVNQPNSNADDHRSRPPRFLRMEVVNVVPDTFCWRWGGRHRLGPAQKAMQELYCHHPFFADYPAVGLRPDQVEAFLQWKTQRHNTCLGEATGLDGFGNVSYELPDAWMLTHLSGPKELQLALPKIEAADLDHWKITVGGYREFLYFVQDSIARSAFSKEVSDSYSLTEDDLGIPNLLNHDEKVQWKKMAIPELQVAALRFCDLSPEQRDKSQLPVEEVLQEILGSEDYLMLFLSRNVRPLFRRSACLYQYFAINDQKFLSRPELDTARSYKSVGGQLNPVPRYPSVGEAYETQVVNVYPDTTRWRESYEGSFYTNQKHEKELMVGLNYEQALAYYHWRRDCPQAHPRKRKVSPKTNPLPAQMIPTQAQWQQVMRGEEPTILQPQYPSMPFFRYVVRTPLRHYSNGPGRFSNN